MSDPERKPFFQRVFRGEFRRSVLTLFSGTSVAVLLSFGLMLVLTRLFDEAMFGVYDAFEKLLMLLFPFASLRYEDALMIPEDDEDAGVIWGLSAALLIALVVLLIPLMVFAEPIASMLGAPALAPWLFLLPPTLLVMRFNQLSTLWLTRLKTFAPISVGQVLRSAGRNGFQLGAGLLPATPNAGGLIGGLLAGHALLSGWFAWHLRRTWHTLRARWSLTHIKSAASRYRRFALFSTPSTLLNNALAALPALLVLYYFGAETNGLYGRAVFPLAVPLSLLGTVISQVFFVHAAEAVRGKGLPALTANVHARLVLVGLFPTGALMLAGPDLLAFLLGAPWRTAGVYVQYLAPWLLLAGIASPLTRLFDILERQRLDLAISLCMFVPLILAFIWGGRQQDITGTLLIVGIVGALSRVAHLGVLLRLGQVSLARALAVYLRFTLYAAPGLALVGWAVINTLHPGLVVLATGIGGAMYLALAVWQEDLI